ncbi:MAG: hypothetical protein P8J17_12880 [Halioglobus sp.]|nr:hypothetical protein [Halioglobus sp.]
MPTNDSKPAIMPKSQSGLVGTGVIILRTYYATENIDAAKVQRQTTRKTWRNGAKTG